MGYGFDKISNPYPKLTRKGFLDSMKFVTKGEMVYQKLKDAIIEGEYKQGERIVIADVTAKYGVSPMPVREAIAKLEKYGYVEVVPHIGARVASMDLDRITEFMMLRMVIEPLVARLAVPYIDEETIKKLEALNDAMEEQMKLNNSAAYEKLNKQFHDLIYDKNPYPYIKEMCFELWNRSEITKTVLSKCPSRLPDSLKEHKLWLQAIKDRNPGEVERIVRMHKENAFEEFKKLMGVNR